MAEYFKPSDSFLVDADTINIGGENFRIQGYDAGETFKFVTDGDKVRSTGYHQGADEQTSTAKRIFTEGNFNNYEVVGKDDHGRKVIRLKNNAGEDFTSTMYRTGTAQVSQFTSEADARAAQDGRIARESGNNLSYQDIADEEGIRAFNDILIR